MEGLIVFMLVVLFSGGAFVGCHEGKKIGHHEGKWAERCRHAQCDTWPGSAQWDGDTSCVCAQKARMK